LSTLMRGLLIGLAVLAITSCHREDENEKLPPELNGRSPPHSNEHTVADGLTLTLEVDKGRCRLAYDEAGAVRHVPLDLPPPCRFKREGAEVRTEKYTSTGRVVTVLIVIGGVAEPDFLVPTIRTDCGNRLQGVLISNGTPVPTSWVDSGVACVGTGMDEKVYQIFHDDEKDRIAVFKNGCPSAILTPNRM